MVSWKREDKSVRKTPRGLHSRNLLKVKCTSEEVKEVLIVENMRKDKRTWRKEEVYKVSLEVKSK